MEIETSIPTFIHISQGRIHDVNVLDMLPILAGSIYIMDRAYLDFAHLYNLHQAGGQFAVRAKKNLQFYRKSSTGLQCDQIIRLTGPKSKQRYPGNLHRVRIIDTEHNQNIVLLTNITGAEAHQIADYYKAGDRSSCSSNGSSKICELKPSMGRASMRSRPKS